MPEVEIANGQMFYEIDGEGEPLLLIHGVRGTIRNWQYLRPHLRQHFQLILPESRGHGRSTPISEVVKMDLFAQDMAALLDELKITECIVAGHSMGGFIAQHMALDQPQRVKTLILIDTAPLVDVEAAKAQIEAGQLAYESDPEKAVETLLGFAFYDPEKIRNTPGMLDLLLFGQHEARRLALSHAYAQGACASFNLQERVHEIKQPTLVIIAAQDDTFPVKWGDFYQEHLENVTVQIIDGSNHVIVFEQPEALAQTIIDYVNP
ncbi:MAG: alpha/beta fold hydrolase [Candidatus Hodarchaeota archaeon]